MQEAIGPPEESIRLRPGSGKKLRSILGCRTDAEVAERIGKSPSMVSRVQNGERPVAGNHFARIVLKAMASGQHVVELFDLIDETGARRPISVVCSAAGPEFLAPPPARRAS